MSDRDITDNYRHRSNPDESTSSKFAILTARIVEDDAKEEIGDIGSRAHSDVIELMEKAEAIARALDETREGKYPGRPRHPRSDALLFVAGAYTDLGEFERAKAIAPDLWEEDRSDISFMVSRDLALAGQIDRAVRETQGNTDALWLVAIICAKTDLAKALEIASGLPEERKAKALSSIVRERVLAQDLEGAATVAPKIRDDDERKEAEQWVMAGRLAAGDSDIESQLLNAGDKRRGLEGKLREILCVRVDAGDMGDAVRILEALSDGRQRALAYVHIAKRHLSDGKTRDCQEATESALTETGRIDNPLWGLTMRAGLYRQIAYLQIKNGQREAAIRTVALARQAEEEHAELFRRTTERGILSRLNDLFLATVMIEAGELREGEKLATQEDGTVLPEAIPMLVTGYIAQGDDDKAMSLTESVTDPEVQYLLYLRCAYGLWQRDQEQKAANQRMQR